MLLSGSASDGKPVYDFDKAWATACNAAGIREALFHDLRRTALMNMIEAVLSEKEAMEISRHKTRVVFDRYHMSASVGCCGTRRSSRNI